MSGSASNGDTWRCEGNNPFSLGMEDLCGCHEKDASDVENIAPKVKKLKLSPKKPHRTLSVLTRRKCVPPNVAKNTHWSLSVKR